MSGGDHIEFEIQPKHKDRKTEIWTVVGSEEYRLGCVCWWNPWERYVFRPDSTAVLDGKSLSKIAMFCLEATLKLKRAVAHAKGYPPCFDYCKYDVPHDDECVPMEGGLGQ